MKIRLALPFTVFFCLVLLTAPSLFAQPSGFTLSLNPTTKLPNGSTVLCFAHIAADKRALRDSAQSECQSMADTLDAALQTMPQPAHWDYRISLDDTVWRAILYQVELDPDKLSASTLLTPTDAGQAGQTYFRGSALTGPSVTATSRAHLVARELARIYLWTHNPVRAEELADQWLAEFNDSNRLLATEASPSVPHSPRTLNR